MSNYIPDVNKFQLAGPPQWWLRKLYDFDTSLVVVPSRQGFFYRLAQRRPLKLSEKMVQELMAKESDTQMLATYGLVPVTTILSTANWDNPLMWQELSERAPWRNGGADKVNELIEQREAEAAAAIDRKNDELLTGLSGDSWKLYRKKIGLGRNWHGSASPMPKHS